MDFRTVQPLHNNIERLLTAEGNLLFARFLKIGLTGEARALLNRASSMLIDRALAYELKSDDTVRKSWTTIRSSNFPKPGVPCNKISRS